MALTSEQQAQIDFNVASIQATSQFSQANEESRRAHDIAMEQRRARLEAVRLAKETLIENARSKPVDARDVSATDITTFANALNQYINQ